MIAFVIGAAVIVVLAVIVYWAYNGLVRSRNRCDAAWRQVDVELKRRHRLIPNLVATVKGYGVYDRGILNDVVAARSGAVSSAAYGSRATQAVAENVLTVALQQVFSLAEAYPVLKANLNYRALRDELSVTEDRITFARQFFNDAVLDYNSQIRTQPRKLLSGPLRFTVRELFEVDPGADTPIVVR